MGNSTVWEFKGNTTDLTQKLKQATNSLAYMSEEAKRVNATFAVCDEETLTWTRALGSMGTSSKTVRGQLSELTAAATELGARYSQLTDEEKASPFGVALGESLDELRGRMATTQDSLNSARASLQSVEEEGEKTGGVIDMLSETLGVNIGNVAKLATAGLSLSGALNVCKDAFLRQESGIDSWGRAMEAGKGAYNMLLDTLNNGNWSNFLQNLETAVNGSIDLYNAMDALGSVKANNALPIAFAENELASLRVRQQNGENVGELIKRQEAIVRDLRSMEVASGRKAGYAGLRQEIMSAYGSVDGAPNVSYDVVTKVIRGITTQGQRYFDRMGERYKALEQKGTRTDYTYQPGQIMPMVTQKFDISLLTRQERAEYALAKAVTERETSLQAYTNVIRQAVDTERNSARETYKYNRWSGRTTGAAPAATTRPGTATTENWTNNGFDATAIATSFWEGIAEKMKMLREDTAVRTKTEGLQAKRTELTERRSKTLDGEERMALTGEIKRIEGRLDAMELPDGMRMDGDGMVLPLKIRVDGDELKQHQEKLGQLLSKTRTTEKSTKNVGKGWQAAATAIGQAGNLMQMMGNPAANVTGIVLEAIANIALGFAQASASPATSAAGVFGWIAAGIAGVAQMVGMIATVKNSVKMETGGIVGGTSLSGDRILTYINSGEMVINRTDQQNLWQMVRSGNYGGMGGTIEVVGRIAGEDIYISNKAYMKRKGKR